MGKDPILILFADAVPILGPDRMSITLSLQILSICTSILTGYCDTQFTAQYIALILSAVTSNTRQNPDCNI